MKRLLENYCIAGGESDMYLRIVGDGFGEAKE